MIFTSCPISLSLKWTDTLALTYKTFFLQLYELIYEAAFCTCIKLLKKICHITSVVLQLHLQ